MQTHRLSLWPAFISLFSNQDDLLKEEPCVLISHQLHSNSALVS